MNSDQEPTVPGDLRDSLARDPGVTEAWNKLTPIGRRDFIAWINDAKQPATRRKRIGICCENLLKGKRRPCCFAVVPMDLYKALGENPQAKAQWSTLTADEKRNLTDWIGESQEKAERQQRIKEACGLLASGERMQPR